MNKALILLVFSACFLSCKNNPNKTDIALSIENTRPYSIESFVENLNNPWGMAWLPDGGMLITEKSGEIIHFKNGIKTQKQIKILHWPDFR